MTRYVQYDVCTLWVVAHSTLRNTMLHMHANTPTHARPVPAIPSTHTSAHPCARITTAKPTHGYLALVLWQMEGRFAPGACQASEILWWHWNLSESVQSAWRRRLLCRRAPDKPTQRSCLCLKTAICHAFAAATAGCEPRARRYGRDIKRDTHYENTVPRQAGLSSKVIATLPGVIHHEFCKDNAKKRNLRTNAS